tara:strand:- start:577 stop:1113 length:537 start_codon:yes stop_codon:yes gene_type:complete
MEDKTIKSKDNDGALTLYGIYLRSKEDVNIDISKLNKGRTNVKNIGYRLYGDIIRSYFSIVFRQIIKGYTYPLLNKFGWLKVVKTLCTRYNPSTYSFKKVDGKIIRKKIELNVNKTDGFFYFVFWDCPKKYRHYRLKVSPKWKRLLFKGVIEDEMDYPDYSLLRYGRNASNSYIQKIK